MILDATTRKLQIVLDEAKTTNDCPVVASYFDSGATPNASVALSNTNGTTVVDIVPAPASSYIRQVNELTVENNDTVSHGVTIRYNDNGTTYKIIKATLAPGYTLTYSKNMGWAVMSPTGLFIAGQIPGTNTNDDAAAGMVGEYIQSTVLVGSAIVLTSGTQTNITSKSFSAGDWNIYGVVKYTLLSGTPSITELDSSVSSTTAAIDTAPDRFGQITYPGGSTVVSINDIGIFCGPTRFSLSSNTTIFLVGRATYTGAGASVGGFGKIQGRRVR